MLARHRARESRRRAERDEGRFARERAARPLRRAAALIVFSIVGMLAAGCIGRDPAVDILTKERILDAPSGATRLQRSERGPSGILGTLAGIDVVWASPLRPRKALAFYTGRYGHDFAFETDYGVRNLVSGPKLVAPAGLKNVYGTVKVQTTPVDLGVNPEPSAAPAGTHSYILVRVSGE